MHHPKAGSDVRSAPLAHPGRVLESAAAPWPFWALLSPGWLSVSDRVGARAGEVAPPASRCNRVMPF